MPTKAPNPAAGTTVLGHRPACVDLAKELNARYLNIPDEIWLRMSDAERWAANQRFLDRMIARGDNIRLATPIEEMRKNTFFAREIEYLFEKGYKASPDGCWLIKQ